MRRPATIVLAGLLLASPALAQDTARDTGNEPAQGTVQFLPKQQRNQDLVSHFLGTPVVNTEGEQLGRVNDLALNPAGQIEVIVIGVGGFLGIAEKNVGVPYGTMARQEGPEGDTQLVLDATQGALTDAPEYLTADNQSLSLTKRLRERAGELTEEAKQTYQKAKDRVIEEAEQYNQ